VSFNINSIKEIVISLMETEKCAELKEKVKKLRVLPKKSFLGYVCTGSCYGRKKINQKWVS
jgi:hypothetical protein